MLFNSLEFLLAFLPISVLAYYGLASRQKGQLHLVWLVSASLFFYAWWNPIYLILIIGSCLFNYSFNQLLQRFPSKAVLSIGVLLNLSLLGYFKYANFFIDSLNKSLGSSMILETIVLPLAISFFTFQQISFLVDTSKGKSKNYSLLHYCLYVTFFPQLIAGPIVRHNEIIHQFSFSPLRPGMWDRLSRGTALFTFGLFKKVMLVPILAQIADPVFSLAAQDSNISFAQAWLATIAYSFQLYLDFSAYSDMALGLGMLFGFSLPQNFNIPYLATSIRDFWQKWHMTLSRFFRDYLYIPLGGNRVSPVRQFMILLFTMLLAGLWHGAAWTFVVWGGIHGIALVVHHGWNMVGGARLIQLPIFVSRTLTFLFVTLAWVLFRAESFAAAQLMYKSLLTYSNWSFEVGELSQLEYIPIAALFSLAGPTAYELASSKLKANRGLAIALAVGVTGMVYKIGMEGYVEFIYFQF